MGRYLRVNTWDAVIDPLRLYIAVFSNFEDHVMRMEMMGMTLQYSVFLLLGYLTIKVIIKIPDRMAL